MNEQLHIIITGERGKTLRLPLAKRKFFIFSISAVALFCILTIISLFSVALFTKNRSISKELTELQVRVSQSDNIIADIQQQAEEEQNRLSQQITSLKLRNANQLASLKEEKDSLLSNAVSELNERSELIETIMKNIGIKVSNERDKKSNQNSGGPFIEYDPGMYDELLYKTDAYLKTIQAIPLGRPVRGPITSRFGPRTDPLNSKKSFHEGIDFRGRRGEKIYATAAGVVARAFKNGSYGNYVEIDHRNGYKTSFAHMQSYVVKKGDHIKRGQLIGKVGNTGRSTGPHLHYELLLKGKPVNPMKYMDVKKLTKRTTPVKVVKLTQPTKILQSSTPVAEKK